jgi:SAM-dependent methyltransferase
MQPMLGRSHTVRLFALPLLLLPALLAFPLIARAEAPATRAATAPSSDGYGSCPPSADGIGKTYFGREIAKVMGHEGGDWLERPEREAEEQPRVLLENMNLRPTDVVADVGAGTGYFTFRIAPLVPQGKVLAEDIQPEMLDAVRARARELGVKNIEPVLGATTDVKLPKNSVDVVLLVDAYHEFDHPREMMESIVRALKPGGRVVQVEYRGEDPAVPIRPHHKMTEAQAKREMAAAGLVYVETRNALPRQHILIFRKSG